MPRQAWSSEDLLTKWVIEQTRHLDLVASWETLLDVYATLGFTDPINDNSRLDEFKWIIRETNKFLTRLRNGLNKAKDFEAARDYLSEQYLASSQTSITTRQMLAYHKLKQRWTAQAINYLSEAIPVLDTEGEEDYE